MLDIFLLTLETLFNAPLIGSALSLLTIIVIIVMTLKFFVLPAKIMILFGYVAMFGGLFYTAYIPIDKQFSSAISNFECTSDSFDVKSKFNHFYSDNIIRNIEAKLIFLEYDNCLKDKNSSFASWEEDLQFKMRNKNNNKEL